MSAAEPISGREPEVQPHGQEVLVSQDAVLDQLNRILTSALFKHSKRCGPLLKYIVTEAIEGRAEHLKERPIGVAVFGRRPTYSTSDDPIVRTSAVEVRKRIAQYYHETGHLAETRIDLPSGSYIPKFQVAQSESVVPLKLDSAEAIPGELTAAPALVTLAPRIARSAQKVTFLNLAVVVAVLATLFAGVMVVTIRSREPINAFWEPLMTSDTITLVVGGVAEFGPRASTQEPPQEPTFYETIQADRVGFADALTTARVTALLRSKGKKFDVRRGGSLTLLDLRKAPAVLVGAVNNPWTTRLEERLRFRFVYDRAHGTTSLCDRKNPERPLWMVEGDAPYSQVKEDRAIVSRFIDPLTEQTVLLLAGFGRDGTAAAGEFVTESKYLEALSRQAPSGWRTKNLQVVISTDLINGHGGPPRIIATHFW